MSTSQEGSLLRVDQRIVLRINSDSKRMKDVVGKYYKNICEETLAYDITESLSNPLVTCEVKLDEVITILQIENI